MKSINELLKTIKMNHNKNFSSIIKKFEFFQFRFEVQEKDFIMVKTNMVIFNFESHSHFKKIILVNFVFFSLYTLYSFTAISSKEHPEYLKKPNKLFCLFNLGMLYFIYKFPSKVISRITLNKNTRRVKLERVSLFNNPKDIIIPLESISKVGKISSSPVLSLLYKIELESSKRREFYLFHVNYNVIKNKEFLNFLDINKK